MTKIWASVLVGLYAQERGTEELLSWRAIIYLKLIRDVINVLDLLDGAMAQAVRMDAPDLDEGHHFQVEVYKFIEKHRLLKLHLAPLRGVRDMLEECVAVSGPLTQEREFGVGFSGGHTRLVQQWVDDAAEVLVGCKEYIQSLWRDDVVNEILACKKFKTSTFDHADIDRIASLDYKPSNTDIIEAGYRTMAVQEHSFILKIDCEREWIFYDIASVKSPVGVPLVGNGIPTKSTFSQRLSWAPFFDDVDGVIFWSSISCFDEQLSEDCRVNCLEDSFCFWRTICSSSILAKSDIVLLLTGCDALHDKIQRGVSVKHYVPGFGDRTNDTDTAMRYFRQRFREISRTSSPVGRPVYVHPLPENASIPFT
ncbi:guanine nucleotide binding protein, alpha subunit [Scleroderma citrinum]